MSYFKKDFMYYVKKLPIALYYIFFISILIFLFLLPFIATYMAYDMHGLGGISIFFGIMSLCFLFFLSEGLKMAYVMTILIFGPLMIFYNFGLIPGAISVPVAFIILAFFAAGP